MNLKKLSDSEHSSIEEVMRNSSADKPMVGIFWYSPEDDELFGVDSVDPDTLSSPRYKTSSKRHDQIWKKQHFKALSKGIHNYFSESSNGYDIPRGRVFQDNGDFFVMVGSWIDKYPSAKSLILEEFNLPDSTEFKYDSHWDIGHGWSGDHM